MIHFIVLFVKVQLNLCYWISTYNIWFFIEFLNHHKNGLSLQCRAFIGYKKWYTYICFRPRPSFMFDNQQSRTTIFAFNLWLDYANLFYQRYVIEGFANSMQTRVIAILLCLVKSCMVWKYFKMQWVQQNSGFYFPSSRIEEYIYRGLLFLCFHII